MNVGSVAEWVGAIGGLLAVIAATVAWLASKSMLNLEKQRDLRRAVAAKREQAELVFAVGAVLPRRSGGERWAVYLYNGSTKPIYDVSISSQKADGRSQNKTLCLSAVPPGRFVVPGDDTYHWGTLIDLDLNPEPVHLIVKGNGAKMIAVLQFKDSAQQRWLLEGGSQPAAEVRAA